MKTKLFTLFLILLIAISCHKEKEETPDYVILTGSILNHSDTPIYIKEFDQYGFSHEITISSEGTFKDTISIPYSGKFYLFNPMTAIYLEQGKALNIQLDLDHIQNTKFTGDLVTENKYLALKDSVIKNLQQQIKKQKDSFYLQKPNVFKAKIADFKSDLDNLILKHPDMKPEFVQEEKRDNHYHYVDYVFRMYPASYKYLTKQPDFKFPEGFLDEGNALDIDNGEDFKRSIPYWHLIHNKIQVAAYKKAVKDSIPYHKAVLTVLKPLKSSNIKDQELESIVGRKLKPGNKNNEDIYQLLMSNISNKKIREKITNSYDRIKAVAKGNDSPTFAYENFKGGKTTLEDLKGNYVYIDVWATWCAPCIKEIPSLKKIEKKYDGKNIKFVSISVDQKQSYDKWKAMIQEKELGGIQLFSDNAMQSTFITKYNISSIPRFILIDPAGKIVNAYAPRPSHPELIELFNALKI